MYSLMICIIIFFIFVIVIRILLLFKKPLHFFAAGLDAGFKIGETALLWKLAKTSQLPDPSSLFWSLPALERSIAYVLERAKSTGTEHTKRTQDFLLHLYRFRTKIELDPKAKHGLTSTKGIAAGQKIRIVLKGAGVFSAQVVSNNRSLVITLPEQDGRKPFKGSEWIGNAISVYLWRENDASYVFDTVVRDSSVFSSRSVLYLSHTEKLLRTQKRRFVRCQCKILAQMYILKGDAFDPEEPEKQPGLKCLLEDISEAGALVRIGGKGIKNLRIKLQFMIADELIVMSGFIRAVDFVDDKAQSLMHFECTHIRTAMKNTVLSYVYNVLPQDEKDMIEAIRLAEKDSAPAGYTSGEENDLDFEFVPVTADSSAVAPGNESEEKSVSDHDAPENDALEEKPDTVASAPDADTGR